MTFHLSLKSTMNRGLWFQKRSQLFIRTPNETSRTIALGRSNPKLSTLAIRS